jgi:hypothetical protein
MRRVCFILLSFLVVAPAALAATRATGDGVLELKAVYGKVTVGKAGQPARGLLWGQMDRGKLVVVDPLPGDGQVYVSGFEKKTPSIVTDTGATITTYTGSNLHFRVTGGKYRLSFDGDGIDLTAIGVGVAYLASDPDVFDPGYYAVDSGKWWAMPDPYATKTPLAVPFPGSTTQSP